MAEIPAVTTLHAGRHAIDLSSPCVMGILNVTADSFYDGGRVDAAAAVDYARRMIGDGARIVDVGGESTRPGATPVDDATELARVLPVVEALARRLIEENRDKVEAMAKALLELETIDNDQISDIMAGKPPRPPKPTSSSTPGSTIAPGTMGGTAPSANPARTRIDG